MDTTSIHRMVAIASATAIATTITISGSAVSSSAAQRDTDRDRPCFMIRSHWNNAEGPQPTCRIPMWQQEASPATPATPATPKRPSNRHPTRGVYFSV